MSDIPSSNGPEGLVESIERDLIAAGAPPIMTAHQVAAHIGEHYQTVWRNIKLGILLGFKAGNGRGRWRVRRHDLAVYLCAGGSQ